MQMMLLEDNARDINWNSDPAKERLRALNKAGNAFRASLTIDKKLTKKEFRATYGPVVRAADIENGWVTGLDNKRNELKLIKPMRPGAGDWIRGVAEKLTMGWLTSRLEGREKSIPGVMLSRSSGVHPLHPAEVLTHGHYIPFCCVHHPGFPIPTSK